MTALRQKLIDEIQLRGSLHSHARRLRAFGRWPSPVLPPCSLDLQNRTRTFRCKDYAHQSQSRSMTLPLEEFLRRFCLHILPPRFVKIRHYGLLSNRDRADRIAQARALLGQVPFPTEDISEPPPLILTAGTPLSSSSVSSSDQKLHRYQTRHENRSCGRSICSSVAG